MTRKLVFWTAFNTYRSEKCLRTKLEGTPHPVTTREWTEKRLELWQKFTLNSLLFQAMTDWLYVVLLDPGLRHLTDHLLPRRDPRVIYCYEDGPVIERLREYDEIVLALIDGDDMYSRHAGRLMMAAKSEWMYFKQGYAYDLHSRHLWRYDTIGSGPFFAHRMDPKLLPAFDRDKRHPTHKAVINLSPEELPGGCFCVLLHELNTSSRPEMRYVLRHQQVSAMILKREFGR